MKLHTNHNRLFRGNIIRTIVLMGFAWTASLSAQTKPASPRPASAKSATTKTEAKANTKAKKTTETKTNADDKTPLIKSEKVAGLTARDVQIWVVSPQDPHWNSQTYVLNGLPDFVGSQRPAPDAKQAATAAATAVIGLGGGAAEETTAAAGTASLMPMPLGFITFEGKVPEETDVVLRGEKVQKFCATWPKSRIRSRRVQWIKLMDAKSVKDPVEAAEMFPAWFSPVQFDETRAYLPSAHGRCLIYDLEMKEDVPVKVSGNKEQYALGNLGAHPLWNVTVIKPQDDQTWRVGSLDRIDPASGKKGDEKSAAAVESKPGSDKKTDKPADAAVNNDAASKVATPAANPTGKPAEQPTENPDKNPDPAGRQVAWEDKMYGSVGEIFRTFQPRFHEWGLGEGESRVVANVLEHWTKSQKFSVCIFRLDRAAMDALLPLEILPEPETVIRVGLVVVIHADPEIIGEIDDLIAKLGDPVWAVREEATAQLQKLGMQARDKIQKGTSHPDAEIAFRCERLLMQISAPGQ